MNLVSLGNLSSCDFTCSGSRIRIKKSSCVIDSKGQNMPTTYTAIVGTIPSDLKQDANVIEVFDDGIGFWKQTSCDSSSYTWSSPTTYKTNTNTFLYRDETSTTYTLNMSDAGYYIRYNTAVIPLSLTIPDDSSVPFPLGTIIEITKVNTGDIDFFAAVGVTLNASGGSLQSMRTTARLIKVNTNEWDIIGDLV